MANYKIFPAIGIARVGNSSEFYLAPETPGGLPIPLNNGGMVPITLATSDFQSDDFRDADKKLRRQAVRFRIYCYPEGGGEPQEVVVGQNGVTQISWTVRLANKKASWYEFVTNDGEDGYPPNHPLRNSQISGESNRKVLIVDPGSRTLNDINQSAYFDRNPEHNPNHYPMNFPPQQLYPLDKYPDPLYPDTPYTINRIGEMHTDPQGRLIVAGGFGRSGAETQEALDIVSYANNDHWWDDMADGPVAATVTIEGQQIEVAPAWVLVTPPAYAPQILNLVTLYDTILDTAIRQMGYCPAIYQDSLWKFDYQPDFVREIKPILDRASLFPWVVAMPPKPHTFNDELLGNPNPEYNSLRQYFFSQIRPPNQKNRLKSLTTGYPMMPYLAGDDCTSTSQKSKKYLTLNDTQYFLLQQWANGNFQNPDSSSESLDVAEQLTRAALENCVGGAFSPGIEMTWICRNPLIYSEPFRIKHKYNLHQNPDYPLSLGMNLDLGLEAGDVSKFMALPWQADFNECSSQPLDRIVWWWPAQRPSFVYLHPDLQTRMVPDETIKDQQVPWVGTSYDQKAPDYIAFSDDLDMVEQWHELGFVFNIQSPDDPYFVEVERNLPRG